MYISGLRKVFVNSHFCNLFGYQIKKKIQKTKNKNRNKKKETNQTNKQKNHYSYIFFSESLSLHVPYDKV